MREFKSYLLAGFIDEDTCFCLDYIMYASSYMIPRQKLDYMTAILYAFPQLQGAHALACAEQRLNENQAGNHTFREDAISRNLPYHRRMIHAGGCLDMEVSVRSTSRCTLG